MVNKHQCSAQMVIIHYKLCIIKSPFCRARLLQHSGANEAKSCQHPRAQQSLMAAALGE